jgi:hypothetical protein
MEKCKNCRYRAIRGDNKNIKLGNVKPTDYCNKNKTSLMKLKFKKYDFIKCKYYEED